MIPRKPVRDSMLKDPYSPMSANMDHNQIDDLPVSALVSASGHAGDKHKSSYENSDNVGTQFENLNEKPRHSSRTPLERLHEKSKKSWRTRLLGGKLDSTIVDEQEMHSNSSTTANEPIEDRETHFEPLDENGKRQLGKNFHPPNQLLHLLIGGFTKWLVTTVLSAVMVAVMWSFSSQQKTLSDHEKSLYNFLIIGISLALGMNIGSSLKAMASDVRWWVLSLKRRSLKEIDLILRLDSLTAVTKLGWVAPRMAPACIAWITLNLVGQIGLALLGLTYSPDSVTDKALLTANGNVTITNMTDLFTENHFLSGDSTADSLPDKQYTANNYGNVALSFYQNDTNHLPTPGTLWSASSPILFVDASSDRAFIEYIFMETNTAELDIATQSESTTMPPSVYTDRSLNTTWDCTSFAVVDGGNGTSTTITIMIDSSGKQQTIPIPEAPGLDCTTFMTNTTGPNCGDGCTIVTAFETSADESWYYQCYIQVSDVQNATLPEHQIGSSLKTLAAQGIALQGKVRDTKQAATGLQYQIYPATAVYGTPFGGSASDKGLVVGYFATGVIAAAGAANPALVVLGNVPTLGSQLKVNWPFVALILSLTVFIQFALFVVVAIVSNLVIVKDESPLSTARLLRPIVDRLGPGGTYAEGKKIIEMLGGNGEDEKLVYSVRHPQQGTIHHLDLGHQKRLRAFPRGEYD